MLKNPLDKEIIIGPDWESLVSKLIQGKGTAMIMGATDSGKSALAKYLIQELVSRNTAICLIDADVGQSSLGLPGTICAKTFLSLQDLQDYSYQKMSFVGTINPAQNIPSIIDTVKKMSSECTERINRSLIDTSGLVDGEIGERLKTGKVRALHPTHIIAVQRGNELEHILHLISGADVHRIIASRNIQARPLATRIRYRKMKYDNYFKIYPMNDFILHSQEAVFLYKGKPLSRNAGAMKKDAVIGLNHNEDTLALGILEDISGNAVTFSSPLDSLMNINRVIFSDITYATESARV
jgi:polynucleotide 5'-hydroxyl-kinase GRC3/NOL9